MTEHKNLTSHRDDLQKQWDAEDNPEEEARLASEINKFNKKIGGVAEQLWPTARAPGPPIGLDDSTALGYPPQRNPSVFSQGVKPQVAPSAPSAAVGGKTATVPPVDPSRLQHAFVGMGQTPGEFARPSNDRPVIGAMGAGVGMGVGLPPGSPSAFNQPAQTKADAAIAKEIGPPSPEGLDEIWNELSEEERQTAIAAMNQGVTAQQIVSHLKAQ